MWRVAEVAPGHGRWLIERYAGVLSVRNGSGGTAALHFDNRDDAEAIVEILEELRMAKAIH